MSSFIHPYKNKTGIDFLFESKIWELFSETEMFSIFTRNFSQHKLVNQFYSSYSRTTYNYEEATASINEYDSLDFEIFPNSTTSFIKIDDRNFTLKKVEVYSIIGKRLMTSTNSELNLENLVNGVYLLKVETENGKFTTKRIVKN